MDRAEEIICTRKIPSTILGDVYAWAIPSVITGGMAWSLYMFSTNPGSESRGVTEFYTTYTVIIFKIVFSLFLIAGIYFLYSTGQRRKVIFFADVKPIAEKRIAVERLINEYKWTLTAGNKNYHLFWENNFLGRPYQITIAIDATGYYINCFSKPVSIDAISAKKKCNEIYASIKSYS